MRFLLLIKYTVLFARWIITVGFVMGSTVILGNDSSEPKKINHPLDPLTADEYVEVISILLEQGLATPGSLYPWITLEEPPKTQILNWNSDITLPRRALVVVMKNSQSEEAVVDLSERTIVRRKPLQFNQPSFLLMEEWDKVQRIVRAEQRWKNAIRKRGIENVEDVVCVPYRVGIQGWAQYGNRRLVNVITFDSRGIKNFWGRPIEGLLVLVDLQKNYVVEVIDSGLVPIPKSPVDFDTVRSTGNGDGAHPVTIEQPSGPGFELNGHFVSWQNWQFHLRLDARVGPVISLVTFKDNGKRRSIIYQASLSELFVPYMDATFGWDFRASFDVGNYGLGKLAISQQPGVDCPAYAHFFNAVFADDWGEPYELKRTVSLFERYVGDVLWRHFEAETGRDIVQRKVELVLRFETAIGNYDYVFDWIFGQEGSIKIVVGSSGIPLVRAVASKDAADASRSGDADYGHMVAENTLGVNHDHFFSFRIDLDVDGPNNSFLMDRFKPARSKKDLPLNNFWVIERTLLRREKEARLRINLERPALWRVINPHISNSVGHPVSYQLKAKANALPVKLNDENKLSPPTFMDYHLWVTPYRSKERFAAGLYPDINNNNDGLQEWTNSDRSIEDTDIVIWYTLGFHHIVRAEDWPVMPMSKVEFELRPFDFFDGNPAVEMRE